MCEVSLEGLRGFVYIKGSIKSSFQIGGFIAEVLYKDGSTETYHIPVTLKGSIKYLLHINKGADKLKLINCNPDTIQSIKAERLKLTHALMKTYGYLLSLYFKKDVLREHIRKNIKIGFLSSLIKPYTVYKRAQFLSYLRNKGFEDFNLYDEYIRSHMPKIEKFKHFYGGVILSWFNKDLKRTIESLNKAGFSEIFVYDKDVSLSDLLKKSKSDYFMFLYSGDEIKDYALPFVESWLEYEGETDLFYSDHVNHDGSFYFKPDWSFYYFIHYDYISNAVFFSRRVLENLGIIERNLGTYALYEAVLKLYKEYQIVPKHIPLPALKKSETLQEWDTGLNVLKSFYGEAIEKNSEPNTFLYKPSLDEEKNLVIIIPTKDKSELLRTCIYSILEKTSYKNYRIVIVDNNSKEEETFRLYSELKTMSNIEIISYNAEYNFSKIVNFAIKNTREEIIVLLNNDTEVLSEDWLEWFVRYLSLKDVGVVGAKLLYPDSKIQHAGVVVGLFGYADHAFKGCKDEQGYMKRISLPQEYLAVTAACMGFRRDVYEEVSGFDEELAVNFNDLDFCLKVYSKGYKVVYLPQAVLIHYEHATRGQNDTPEKIKLADREKRIILSRWNNFVRRDPYYNPNLTLYRRDFSLYLPNFYWLE